MAGKAAATFLLDVSKAFEHARHDRLWLHAQRHTLLAWLLRMLRMLRRLQLGGGCSVPVVARRSAVPGAVLPTS